VISLRAILFASVLVIAGEFEAYISTIYSFQYSFLISGAYQGRAMDVMKTPSYIFKEY